MFIVFFEDFLEREHFCGIWYTEQEAKDYVARLQGSDGTFSIRPYTIGEEYC